MTNILKQEVTKPQCTKALLQLGDNKYSLTSTGVAEIDMSNVPNGVYIIILRENGSVRLNQRFCVNH